MKFYSILYISDEDEKKARTNTKFSFRIRQSEYEKKYELRGNKLIRKSAENKNQCQLEEIPAFYEDTHLDQIIDALLFRNADKDLKEAFYTICPDKRMIVYRQQVLQALENADILRLFQDFCQSVENAKRLIAFAEKAHHSAQSDKYILDGSALYFEAVQNLLSGFSSLDIPSEGLSSFLNEVRSYAAKPQNKHLESLVRKTKEEVESISYRLCIQNSDVILSFEPQKKDFIQETCEDFNCLVENIASKQEAPVDIHFFGQLELCPLEILITNELEHRYINEFEHMREASEAAAAIPEPFIDRFVSEMRFYFRYRELISKLQKKGIHFSYPDITLDQSICINGAYDIALALKADRVIENDIFLIEKERGAVITGANQAGKTTYLCTIGQIALLAALGLPVPCRSAKLPLYGRFLSHFSETEEPSADYGKLKEELLRIKPILQEAGIGSLVLLNELFSSTTAEDAQDMTNHALSRLIDAGASVFCVTHITGISPPHMINMISQIEPESHKRLYKIIRAPAEPHAYADEIALKYHLTYQEIKERINNGV